MDLILDIGNTHSKAAFFLNDGIHKKFVFDKNEDGMFDALSDYKPDRMLMSSSNGSLPQLPEFLKEVKTIVFNHTTPVPVQNLYESPETLGRDRLAAAVGSAWLYPGKPVLSIDCGTCVTYDFVNRQNQYLGGSISPGMRMRYKALNQFTGSLPNIAPDDHFSLPGKTTEESIRSGVQQGMIYEMEGQIEFYRRQYPDSIVIITGGDARYFVNRLKYEIFANQNLVLLGLHQILKHNDQ